MWNTGKKIIPLSKIHASNSPFYLAGATRYLNPANFFSASKTDLNHTFRLASIVYALTIENEKLQEYVDGAKDGSSEAKFYKYFLRENRLKLDKIIPKARSEVVFDGSLPIDLVAGFAYVMSTEGLLTKELFDSHLKARVEEKLEFASVQGLVDLGRALLAIQYDTSSDLWRRLGERVKEKLRVSSL